MSLTSVKVCFRAIVRSSAGRVHTGVIVALAACTLVLAWWLVGRSSNPDHERKTGTAESATRQVPPSRALPAQVPALDAHPTPETRPPVMPAAGSQRVRETERREQAVEKGIAYLRSSTQFPDRLLLPLTYLERKFDLELAPPYDHDALDKMRIDRGVLRILDPNKVLTEEDLATYTGTDEITARALHCDLYPLPQGFADRVESASGQEDYFPAFSAAFATQWMAEGGCLAAPRIARLRDVQTKRMVAAVEEVGPTHYIGMEAMALLYMSGAGNRVRDEWVRAVTDAQQPDGAWPYAPGQQEHQLATAFALWVLLENTRPNTPDTPWVMPRQP